MQSGVMSGFSLILTAEARNLALARGTKVTVVQSACDYGLHTRENAITWASVGWAGRSLGGVTRGNPGVVCWERWSRVLVPQSPKPLMGHFENLNKSELRELRA